MRLVLNKEFYLVASNCMYGIVNGETSAVKNKKEN